MGVEVTGMKAISGAIVVLGAVQILLSSYNNKDVLLLLGVGLGVVGLAGWIYGLIAEK
jgi:uncharacterized membrane protein